MRGTLTFTRPDQVVADTERPGLLRADRNEADGEGAVHVCELTDLSVPGTIEPGLEAAGFETIDLTGNEPLQQALAEVRRADRLTPETDTAIRAGIRGMQIELTSGTRLRVDHVSDDGLFHRRSGPAWTDVNPGGIDGVNGHGGAQFVHGDQDVYGTPLRQLMHGAAPDVFRHVTPDGRNDDAGSFLLNLWIPLHAPVQPLALMDHRTLDGPRHQLRYGLPVDGFLDRDEDEVVNDIWSFLHDDGQRWYVRTDMDARHGYLFNTLGTGHGAACLPGENALAHLFLTLRSVPSGVRPPYLLPPGFERPTPPDDTPATIRVAWQRLSDLVDEGEAMLAGDATDENWTDWRDRVEAATDHVIRRSIELRLVASIIT